MDLLKGFDNMIYLSLVRSHIWCALCVQEADGQNPVACQFLAFTCVVPWYIFYVPLPHDFVWCTKFQRIHHSSIFRRFRKDTLPETNIVPEN